MQFRLLVFDWDGTLMDSAARIVACMQSAALDLELPAPSTQAVQNIIGLGLQEALDQLLPDADAVLRQTVIERYRHHYLVENQMPEPLFPGVTEMLTELEQADYLLAVATGKSRRGLDRALERTGLKQQFLATRCADETFSKPHPAMLQQLMDELGVLPTETLMIGDSEYDLQMACNAGTASLAVSYGVHSPERLSQYQPLACLDTPDAIPPWLESLQQ